MWTWSFYCFCITSVSWNIVQIYFILIFVLFLRCSTIPTEQSLPPSLLNISIIELSLPHNNKSICWAETYVLVLRSTVTCGGTIVNASGMILSKCLLEVLRKKFFNKQLTPIYVFDPWFHPILISKAVIRGISFIICQFNFMLIITPISLFPLFYLGWQGFSYSITYGQPRRHGDNFIFGARNLLSYF